MLLLLLPVLLLAMSFRPAVQYPDDEESLAAALDELLDNPDFLDAVADELMYQVRYSRQPGPLLMLLKIAYGLCRLLAGMQMSSCTRWRVWEGGGQAASGPSGGLGCVGGCGAAWSDRQAGASLPYA
jgi:hypothetical protein